MAVDAAPDDAAAANDPDSPLLCEDDASGFDLDLSTIHAAPTIAGCVVQVTTHGVVVVRPGRAGHGMSSRRCEWRPPGGAEVSTAGSQLDYIVLSTPATRAVILLQCAVDAAGQPSLVQLASVCVTHDVSCIAIPPCADSSAPPSCIIGTYAPAVELWTLSVSDAASTTLTRTGRCSLARASAEGIGIPESASIVGQPSGDGNAYMVVGLRDGCVLCYRWPDVFAGAQPGLDNGAEALVVARLGMRPVRFVPPSELHESAGSLAPAMAARKRHLLLLLLSDRLWMLFAREGHLELLPVALSGVTLAAPFAHDRRPHDSYLVIADDVLHVAVMDTTERFVVKTLAATAEDMVRPRRDCRAVRRLLLLHVGGMPVDGCRRIFMP